MRKVLQVTGVSGFEPEIGRWLWMMEETRRSTLATVKDIPQDVLDWEGTMGDENSIGSLLYHVALVEVEWLFLDILERDVPAEVRADFLHGMVDGQGRLARVPSVPLAVHINRLERSRAVFLQAMRSGPVRDWRRPRSPADVDYRVTPEWVVFHLVEHEAGHLFQIRAMKARATRHLAVEDRGG